MEIIVFGTSLDLGSKRKSEGYAQYVILPLFRLFSFKGVACRPCAFVEGFDFHHKATACCLSGLLTRHVT